MVWNIFKGQTYKEEFSCHVILNIKCSWNSHITIPFKMNIICRLSCSQNWYGSNKTFNISFLSHFPFSASYRYVTSLIFNFSNDNTFKINLCQSKKLLFYAKKINSFHLGKVFFFFFELTTDYIFHAITFFYSNQPLSLILVKP